MATPTLMDFLFYVLVALLFSFVSSGSIIFVLDLLIIFAQVYSSTSVLVLLLKLVNQLVIIVQLMILVWVSVGSLMDLLQYHLMSM